MKTSLNVIKLKNLKQCVSYSTLTSLVLSFLSLWLSLPGHVMKNLRLSSLSYVLQVRQIGPVVNLQSLRQLFLQNKRHLIGVVLLVMGVVSIFAHQIFSDPYVENHAVCSLLGGSNCYDRSTGLGWCYVSWFYYLYTVRLYLAILLWSVGGILFVPLKYNLAVIPFSLIHSFGWINVIHYSFFASSFENYHAFPLWSVIVLGFSLGFGIVMSANYLLHNYNHRFLAFEKRLLTMYNGADLLDGDQFKGVFKKYVEEKQAYQKTI